MPLDAVSTLWLKDAALELSSRTHIMGVINVTPDSFSDGGRFIGGYRGGRPDFTLAVETALKMAEDGADIIDVGGESTRPGAERLPLEEELARVVPVIEGIRKHSNVPVSIDTYKSETAKAAVLAGASIINDISGGGLDPDMLPLAASVGAAVILMHIKGTPADMQREPHYEDVVREVKDYLAERADMAVSSGIPRDRILVDPGIGFGKTMRHNLELINRIGEIAALGYPVVLGTSRKAFIGRLTGVSEATDRLEGTIASCVVGIVRGAKVIRVHDVRAAKRAATVADAILRAGGQCLTSSVK